MRNRFITKKSDFSILKSIFPPVLLFAAIFVLFGRGLTSVSDTTREEQLNSVRNAITRAIVQCYAVEGQYPPSIGYLSENYGLAVDTDRYIVDYRVFASNIMPSVEVLPKDFGSGVADDFVLGSREE